MAISIENNIITQTVDVSGALASPLSETGGGIKKVLVKQRDDGTEVIVPPCASEVYPIMLDREIDAGKDLIAKPSFWKMIGSNILFIIGFVVFAEMFLDLDGETYLWVYFGIIVGGIIQYVWSTIMANVKNEALSKIRKILMNEYVNYLSGGATIPHAPVMPVVATEKEIVVPEVPVNVAPVSIAKVEVHTPPEVPIKEEPIVAPVEAPVFVQDSHNHPTSNIIVPDSKGSITISRGGLYVIIGLSVLVVLLVIALIGALVPDESVAVTPLQEQVVVLEDEVEDDDSVIFVEEPVESDVVVVSTPVPAPVKVKMTREQELNELLDSEDNNGTGAWADMSRERNTLKKQRENPEYDSSADPESSDYDPALFEDPEGMGWASE